VAIETFCATVILASSSLTRCAMGALEPTHGQAAFAADAAAVAGAAAPATTDSDAEATAAASATARDIFRLDGLSGLRIVPPDVCFTGIAVGVRKQHVARRPHAELGFLHNIVLGPVKVDSPGLKQKIKKRPRMARPGSEGDHGKTFFPGVSIPAVPLRDEDEGSPQRHRMWRRPGMNGEPT
jgi:hypothetical protein